MIHAVMGYHLTALLLGCAICLSAFASPPTTVVIRVLSGPWESTEYVVAHGTLTVRRYPAVGAADRTPKQLVQVRLPPDAAYQRLAGLDPAAYRGIAHESLDGGGVLAIDLVKGSAKQTVCYQSGQYLALDETTAFLLTYIDRHVPAALALGPDWMKPQPRSGRFGHR